jgi:hypothetical protein
MTRTMSGGGRRSRATSPARPPVDYLAKVRVCVRACVCVCARARVCVCACMRGRRRGRANTKATLVWDCVSVRSRWTLRWCGGTRAECAACCRARSGDQSRRLRSWPWDASSPSRTTSPLPVRLA